MNPRPRATKARRPGSRHHPRVRRVVLALVLTLGAFATLLGTYLLVPKRGRGVTVRVTIPAGADPPGVTAILWRTGVIEHPRLFRPILALSGTHDRVRPGMVLLRDDLAPHAVLRALRRAGGWVRVTIPEGFTRFDIARKLDAMGVCDDEAFLAATESPAALRAAGVTRDPRAPSSIEGYLFPDTYDLPLGSSCERVIGRMVAMFHRRLEVLRARHPEGFARLTRVTTEDGDPVRVLVTLASIVEKETGHPDDRPHVASVFWNRLTRPEFRPRLLQSDPTVTYGCLAGPRAGLSFACATTDAGSLTAGMLEDARNPWNTYRHEGLPPTPVCNPGSAALEAVLAPVVSDDLYFVARGDGRSVFAATLEAHRRNVREHLRARPRSEAPRP